MLIFLRNLFLKNWGLKLFSFILALILWLTLIPEEKIYSEKTVPAPLELHNIPSDMEVVEKPPTYVDVKIRAPKRLIPQITSDNVRAVLDLQGAVVTQRDFPLNKDLIELPVGAEVEEILPGQVTLRMEKIREMPLTVEADLTGRLPEGYSLVRTLVIPEEVMIKGPESKFRDTYRLRTMPIDISTLTQSIEFEVDLILPSPDLRLASSQTQVVVRLIIQKDEDGDGSDPAPARRKSKVKRG
jgi:YbbR domain-containing protein